MEWVNWIAALIQGRGGVVILFLIAIISAWAGVVALARRWSPRTAVQVQTMSGSYDRATSILSIAVPVIVAPPVQGMAVQIKPWWSVRVGRIPIAMRATSVSRAIVNNRASLLLTANTQLIPLGGAEVTVRMSVRAIGGDRHKVTQVIRVV